MAIERDDVQRRFRRLVRLAHPDHGGESAGAAERIAELAEARELLLSVVARDADPRASFARVPPDADGACERVISAAWLPTPVHVTVTGAAGQIGYALVHRIASRPAARRRPAGRAAPARDRARDAARSKAW